MKIYGGHDYYDSVLGYGADPTVVMVRSNKHVELPKGVSIPHLFDIELWNDRFNTGRIRHIKVVFCSKVYAGIEISAIPRNHYFWSAEKLWAWFEAEKKAKREKLLLRLNAHWRDYKKKYKVEDYFSVVDAPEKLRDYMITNRYAILLDEEDKYNRRERNIRMNPDDLRRVEFMKAVDPYTAFQELSMWVGGVLAGESPKTVTIKDNNVLIENHGFDKVFSFRGPRIP